MGYGLQALFVADAIYTGYNLGHCIDYLSGDCTSDKGYQTCKNALIGGTLGVAGGLIKYLPKIPLPRLPQRLTNLGDEVGRVVDDFIEGAKKYWDEAWNSERGAIGGGGPPTLPRDKPPGYTGPSTADPTKGRVLPRNLREELAVEEALSIPASRKTLGLEMNDPRWPAKDGWVKKQHIHKNGEANINVHYLYNELTGAIADPKIVLK